MLRLLAVLLWIPISTQANVHQIENQRTRLELSEILSGMDSTESILIFYSDRGELINTHTVRSFRFDTILLQENIDLLQSEYLKFKANPYAHDVQSLDDLLSTLYTLLIEPVREEIRAGLIIIPSVATRNVPWNILMSSNGQYLIEQTEIVVAVGTSAHTYAEPLAQGDIHIFALAPEFKGVEMINNQSEKEHLFSLFQNTTEKMLTSDLIHVSSHGLEDAILVNGDKDLFKVGDLADMKISARLVFLNACYSSQLAEEFVTSGAASAIGIQWQVDDRVAIRISEIFYGLLLEGKTTAAALRESVLQYKANCELSSESHPFQWGGYQIYGKSVQIVENDPYHLMRIFSVFLSFCTTFSLISYHFGAKLRGKMMEYNLI